jgi:hypothetical protein
MLRHGHTRGGSPTPEYRVWLRVKRLARERGNICPEWKDSFSAFLAEMGPRPSKTHVFDRLDPDGVFDKCNCIWAQTRLATGPNPRNSKRVSVRGVEYPSYQAACDDLGLNYSAVRMRLASGKSVDQAFSPLTRR